MPVEPPPRPEEEARSEQDLLVDAEARAETRMAQLESRLRRRTAQAIRDLPGKVQETIDRLLVEPEESRPLEVLQIDGSRVCVLNGRLVSTEAGGRSVVEFMDWSGRVHQVRIPNGGLLDQEQVPVPHRDGYDFVAWVDLSTGGKLDLSRPVEGDATYIQTWKEKEEWLIEADSGPAPEPRSFHVAFLDDEGTEIRSIQVQEGQRLSSEDLPKPPTREGCEFLAWVDAETRSPLDLEQPLASDLVCVPSWREAEPAIDGGYWVVVFAKDGQGTRLDSLSDLDPRLLKSTRDHGGYSPNDARLVANHVETDAFGRRHIPDLGQFLDGHYLIDGGFDLCIGGGIPADDSYIMGGYQNPIALGWRLDNTQSAQALVDWLAELGH